MEKEKKSAVHSRRSLRKFLIVGSACLLLTGCQVDKESASASPQKLTRAAFPSPTPWKCAKESIHWGIPQQRQKLVAASQLVKSEEYTKGTTVKFAAIPVHNIKPIVSASLPVNEDALVTSLEQRMGLELGSLAKPGKSARSPEIRANVSMEIEHKDADYISVIGATAVEANFVVGCVGAGDKPIYGTITSWHKRVAGVVECGTDPREEYARTAYSLLCGESSK
ncbi:hypothetical protein [Streptomyces cyaneofuscatus]|uniref:hypothetical protein n=1 Tax=Streptomyces cyaneofuscatus TaxID=66883 RepID=UPI0036C77881